MLSDIEIAQRASLRPIRDVASDLGLGEGEWLPYGRFKAKIDQTAFDRLADRPDGKLVLVTAINPTPAGEGKTTTTVGLGQALCRLGKRAVIALREPSLGPVFGIKGGAAGGGYAQVVPMEEINLHFTGDLHAITSANNLLSALIDNHLQQGNALGLDARRIVWRRCLDINDRALRHLIIGLGGRGDGIPREEGFNITAASEIMAVLCLASDMADLIARLERLVIGYTRDGGAVTAGDLNVAGALGALLKDALQPNLVQTLEGTPALIHGGPFANIAHGCSSLMATRLGLKLGDYLLTEAGFGADLGAEKFFDIKCRAGSLNPAAAVLVATVRALKYNGGQSRTALAEENLVALKRGLPNLIKHIENLRLFGVPTLVVLNRFATDTEAELALVAEACAQQNVRAVRSDAYSRGGAGGEEAAQALCDLTDGQPPAAFQPLYPDDLPLREKIRLIARRVYGADDIVLTAAADKDLAAFSEMGYDRFPVCIAKTQYSLSDDPTRLSRPTGWNLTVREARLSAGAGFVVALTGEIMTMPGLPKKPAAESVTVTADGTVSGLS